VILTFTGGDERRNSVSEVAGGPSPGERPKGREAEVAFEQALLGDAAFIVDLCAESSKRFWRGWGELGSPMIQGVEVWADMQHRYLRAIWEAHKAGGKF